MFEARILADSCLKLFSRINLELPINISYYKINSTEANERQKMVKLEQCREIILDVINATNSFHNATGLKAFMTTENIKSAAESDDISEIIKALEDKFEFEANNGGYYVSIKQ